MDFDEFIQELAEHGSGDKCLPARYPMPECLMGLRENSGGVPTNTWLNAQARAQKGALSIPGVRVWDDGKLTRSGGRRR